MNTAMEDRLARLRRSVEGAWGEDWVFRPMSRPAGPNAAAVPDPRRPVVDPIVGVYAEAPALAFETARGASFAPTPSAGSTPMIHLVSGDLAVRTGDRVERKATGEVFTLSTPRPSGHGRVAWHLMAAS